MLLFFCLPFKSGIWNGFAISIDSEVRDAFLISIVVAIGTAMVVQYVLVEFGFVLVEI